MTPEQIQARSEQLSAQIKPNGGHAHHPAFNGTFEINKLIAELTSRIDMAAALTIGNATAETLTAAARAEIDAARPKLSNQLDYQNIFLSIATVESLVDELEAMAGM